MKNKVCIKKIVVCFILIAVVGAQSIESSFAAVEWYHAFSPLAVFVDKMASAKDAAALEDAIALGYSFWKSSPSSNYAVELSRDTLDELCSQLNQAGFPCYVGYRADVYGGAYCIVGNGYLTVSSNSYADRKFNISGRVYTNSDGEAYLSYVSYTANDYLGRMDSLLRSIDNHLNEIEIRLLYFYDFITGAFDEGRNSPGTNLYDKMDEIVTAIEGISGVGEGGTFDTTSITDKLDEVVNALDPTPITDKLQEVITSIEGISIDFDTLPIVTELQSILRRLMAVDFATNERVDALLGEIQKISTHADLKEVVTVTPGVLGDVEVVTTGGWTYSDLQFSYNPEATFFGDGSPIWSLNADNLYVNAGSAQVDHCVWDFNSWGSFDLQISISDLLASSTGAPSFTLNLRDSSFNLVQTITLEDLRAGPMVIPVSELNIFMIQIEFPDNAYWYLDNFSGTGEDILQFKYGNKEYPSSESLSFTADGVPHTLYWSNEYEIPDGCIYPWQTIQYLDGHWYLEGSWPLAYYDAYLTDALTSAPTTVTTVEGETYTWFEWFYTSYGKGGSGGASDLTPVVMRLDTIIENLNATVGVAGCNHTYRDELDQEATCILPGLMNHTCSQCGSCYSEIIPSLGHNWEHKGWQPDSMARDEPSHHLFECTRCGEIFQDFESGGDPDAVPDAPAKESDSITSIIARLFEKLGNFAGQLLSGIITLLDKLLTGFDQVVTNFNEKAEQIATVGGDYPQWLSGVWGIIPADLQLVLTFCVIVTCVTLIGKKIFFVS